MAVQVRRIVTGYDAEGRSTVEIDAVAPLIPEGVHIWSSENLPVDNAASAHDAPPLTGPLTVTPSSSFAVIEFPPGTHYDLHYTDTIDYVYLAAGELVLVMETGETRLRAGDLLVQRGTIHGWRNETDEVARLIAVLIAAQPRANHRAELLFDNDLAGQNPG